MGDTVVFKQVGFQQNTEEWLRGTLRNTSFHDKVDEILNILKDSKSLDMNTFNEKHSKTDPSMLQLVYVMSSATKIEDGALSIPKSERGRITDFLTKRNLIQAREAAPIEGKKPEAEKLDSLYSLKAGGRTYVVATANMPQVFLESLFNFPGQLERDLKKGETIKLVSVTDEFNHTKNLANSEKDIKGFMAIVNASQKAREKLAVKKM